MVTRKPFSTISYNTNDFLELKLGELIESNKIQFCAWIEHAPEEDENETKFHKHLYIEPSGEFDTSQLVDYLKEVDPKHNKPLGIMPCHQSKFVDWYFYGLHDAAYLASKGQSRKYHYTYEQIRNSHPDYFNHLISTIDRSHLVGSSRLKAAIENGMTFEDCVCSGLVPIQLVMQYEKVYNCLARKGTYRNGRETHTPKQSAKPCPVLVDEETGEVVATASNGGRDRRKSRSAAQVSFDD